MGNFYPYLASSLPMLHFGGRMPFSYAEFLERCSGSVPDKDLEVLKRLESYQPQDAPVRAIRDYLYFDTLLRNELVKIRAERKKKDPAKYLRPDGSATAEVTHIAMAAHRAASPLEGERALDGERWSFLEWACAGHYFDLEFIIGYAYKLLILERWERIRLADRDGLLEGALK